MSAHPPHISEDMLRELPSTISHVAQRMLLVVGIATTVISIAGEWSHGHHFLNQWLVEQASVLGALLNILLVALVLFPSRLQPLTTDLRDSTVRRAAQCVNAFCLPALTWFWRSLGLLYVVLLYRQLAGAHPHEAITLHEMAGWPYSLSTLLVEAFSALGNFSLLMAYASLTPGFLTAYMDDGRDVDSWEAVRERNSVGNTTIFLQCVAAILPFAVVSILVHGWIMHYPNPVAVAQLATTTNGVASAIALAFLVGRIDSKFVLNWQWAIPLLYCYCGVQVFSTALHAPVPFERAVFIYAAFTLKCVLFIFLSNFFETRRVLYFAVEVHQSVDRSV